MLYEKPNLQPLVFQRTSLATKPALSIVSVSLELARAKEGSSRVSRLHVPSLEGACGAPEGVV